MALARPGTQDPRLSAPFLLLLLVLLGTPALALLAGELGHALWGEAWGRACLP